MNNIRFAIQNADTKEYLSKGAWTFSEHIADCVFFARPENAIRRIKEARDRFLDAAEHDFVVVPVECTPLEPIFVPRKEMKTGYIIQYTKQVYYDLDNPTTVVQFYKGPKKSKMTFNYAAYSLTPSKENSTVFPSQKEAESRLIEIVSCWEKCIADEDVHIEQWNEENRICIDVSKRPYTNSYRESFNKIKFDIIKV